MKKKMSFLILAIMVISILLVSKFNTDAKTVEEALTRFTVSKPISIIHEEKTVKGSILFYTHPSKGDFSTCFVKKSIFGYKVAYSGVGMDEEKVANMFGLSYYYWPNINGTSLPLYFGTIGNHDVSQVKIVEKKRNVEGTAKIINVSGMRIWLISMKGYQGSEFDIIGLSADGKELVRIEDNISPHYAEEKPFKGY